MSPNSYPPSTKNVRTSSTIDLRVETHVEKALELVNILTFSGSEFRRSDDIVRVFVSKRFGWNAGP